MGNRSSKSGLRNAFIRMNICADSISLDNENFWDQIWSEDSSIAAEIIRSISCQEIRMLRDGSPKNFATLTYKMVERLHLATGTLCNTHSQQTAVLNASRILTRLIPCIFEDKCWNNFFIENSLVTGEDSISQELKYPRKSDQEKNYRYYLPTTVKSKDRLDIEDSLEIHDNELGSSNQSDDQMNPGKHADKISSSELEMNENSLVKSVVLSTCNLLFCPEFTVSPRNDSYLSNSVDAPPEDLKSLITCDYVWEPGVGFDSWSNSTTYYDKNRSEILRLLLTCLSTALYQTPGNSVKLKNYWVEIFASNDNRHALPLFTSLLNTIFIYKPSSLLPFNHLIFEDTREELVELSLQILIVTLDYQFDETQFGKDKKNLFVEYMSRIHRSEDFSFLLKGFTRLLSNCLEQSYLLNASKQINFDQELLILLWKISNLNRKFISFVLKTRDILDIIVPILYHLNENFQNPAKTALIHIGVFNLLILSSERNFGVRLNKPYLANVLLNIPTFTGSHADLMIIVFHKLILYGFDLHQLYDFMLTIVVNVSPYLKTISMLASKCLIQLFEIFSSPVVVFTEPNYHQLVIFLLEIFNNLIQYQFDGNANLVYAIVSKKQGFVDLANLTSSPQGIQKVLNKLIKQKQQQKLLENESEKQNEHTSPLQNRVKNTIDNTKHIGATISSNHLHSPQSTKCEVSLVATPEIGKVTQAVYPFNADCKAESKVNTKNEEKATISFDDILNQTSSFITQPTTSDSAPSDDLTFDITGLVRSNFPETSNTTDSRQPSNRPTTLLPKRWRPTPEWTKQWKQTLPLHTILRMIEVLIPQLDRLKQDVVGQPDEIEIIKFLQNGTLVGLLPVPHPILIRKYRTNDETTLWFRTCTWGTIYVRNTIWTDTIVRLVKVV